MKKLIQRHAGWFQLVFVVAVVGAAFLLSIALKPEQTTGYGAPSADPVVVSIVEPEALLFEPSVSLNGVVEARTITDVIPQVGGKVIEVSPAFRAGADFSKGEVLFRIDPADYDLAVERTLAEIEAARSELALLEAQAAAERQIWDQQFGDRKIPDLIAKVPQIAAANARIHSGEAARAAAELSLSRTTVRAPFDGRVLDTQLDVGQVVGAGVTVGSVFSVDSLEIAVPVSADELAMLGNVIGRRAAVSREAAADSALTAEVVRQSAGLDDRTRLRTLFLTPDRPDDLTLGEFVGLEIRGQAAPQALRLPAAALTSRDKVWVVDDGRLRMREVDVVGNEGNFAVVRSFDMANGVVAVPPSSGREGLPVTIKAERQSLSNNGSQVVGAQ